MNKEILKLILEKVEGIPEGDYLRMAQLLKQEYDSIYVDLNRKVIFKGKKDIEIIVTEKKIHDFRNAQNDEFAYSVNGNIFYAKRGDFINRIKILFTMNLTKTFVIEQDGIVIENTFEDYRHFMYKHDGEFKWGEAYLFSRMFGLELKI